MEIIDNQSRLLLDELKEDIKNGGKLSISSSCFSMYAFSALKDELLKIDELKFIFTASTFTEDKVSDKIRKEKREFFIPKHSRENSIYGTEFEIKLRNQLSQKAIAKECADWIRNKVTFKSNDTGAAMPNFIGVEGTKENTVYLPVNGFTAADLGIEHGNNLFQIITKTTGADSTAEIFRQFDEVWNDGNKIKNVTENILQYIECAYTENSPDFIYFYTIYNIFTQFLDELSDEYMPNERTGFKNSIIWDKLYNFQRDGVVAILNKLEKYNGCILADSVGLGKTFTTLGVMQYYSSKNKSILVLAPKRLAENWNQYKGNTINNPFYEDKIRYDVLYHTDLGRRRGYSNGIDLATINWGNYDLVVIDESHNFRNNNPSKGKETRYEFLMNKVMKAGLKTKVLMVSATPVNNRYNDLKNQLALAYCGDYKAFNENLDTTRSVQEIFRNAQRVFNEWSKQAPEKRKNNDLLDKLDIDFRTLLDSVTIARSRKNITKFYDTKDIGNFPKRKKAISYRCDLTDLEDVIEYKGIYSQLKDLILGVYTPFNYVLQSRKAKYEELLNKKSNDRGLVSMISNRESGVKRLMTVNLLKRLESSCEAFRKTLKKMLSTNYDILKKIDRYEQFGEDASITKTHYEYESDDLDEDGGFALFPIDEGTTMQFNMSDIDCRTWRRDIEGDISILQYLQSELSQVTPEHDTKLNTLKELISDKINNPFNDDNRKLLIFSASADTASYLYENISKWAKAEFGIETAKVEGGDSLNKCTLANCSKRTDDLLSMFSPISKNRKAYIKAMLTFANGESPEKYGGADVQKTIDIMIGTDCISEGQNLQDCDVCVNYDIHWNPVRIVQRFGRIDRIGSKNEYIQLVNFWPNVSLDEYINLNNKVESRMAMVDNTTGAEDNLLTEDQVEYAYRSMQIKKLQDGELQDLEDVDGSITLTDLGLSDFRMDVVSGIKKYGEPIRVPKGMHAVISENLDRGIKRGVIYILRNTSEDVKTRSKNQLKDCYLVYIQEDSTVILDHLRVKDILDIMRSGCRSIEEPIEDKCKEFNKETKDGYKMQKYSSLLEDAILSIVDAKERDDINSLFSTGGTTALVDDIQGFEDFELISFIVVR